MSILLCAIAGVAQAGNWGYYVEGNGAVITSAPSDLSGVVTVPSQLGGHPVVSIGDYVGQSCNAISSLTIPESVTNIGCWAFSHCKKLKSVAIGSNVRRIGRSAFTGTPLMEVEDLTYEIAYIGNWAMGFKICIVDDASQITFEDVFGSYSDVRKFDIELKSGTKHIADHAFESVGFKDKNRSEGGWDFGYTIPYGTVTLPNGLLTIGDGAFSSTFYSGTCRAEDLIIPATVTSIGAQSLSGLTNRRICFKGKQPHSSGLSFSQEHPYGGTDISTVYYSSGVDGWSYGGDWCGVKTYPWSWSEKRTSKITLGPAYEYNSDVADHELQLKEEVEDDEYVAIPVYGATSAFEINPVVVHHNSTAADIAAIEIRTDAQMFSAIVQPLLKYKSQWNSSSSYYYIYTSNVEGCWPTSLWPDNKAVSGRFWIIVMPNAGNWYGMRDFRVGLFGTDEVTDRIYLANDSTYGPAACDKACLDTKRVTYGGKSAPRMNYGQAFVQGGIGTTGDCLGGTHFKTENVKPASFTATVSESGMFVLTVADYDMSYNQSTRSYTYIGENYKSQMTVSGGTITADSEECHEEAQSIIDEVNTNRYWRHGGGACVRRVTVGKAGTYTFASKSHSDIAANRVHFFPASRKSVAVDAICMTAQDFSTCSHDIAYGYVLGSGVFVAGETVSFSAVPAPNNQFDHWEVAFADNHEALSAALAGKSMTSPTLSFTVTDAMCGEMTEEKQIVIRAVWKEKHIPEIIPSPIGAATVSGNKEIFEGENVTVTLKPDKNCSFVRWIDNADCGTSRTFSYDASGSDEPMRAIFSGTPVNPVPHIEVENLEDSYAVGAEIDPISVGVESGTGYSVKVTGLPAGLSYTNGRITGTPTKNGSFTVTATATKSGASTLTTQFTINVTVKFDCAENDDGTITLIDVAGNLSGELVIPSTYEGRRVTKIADCFLKRNSGVTSLIVPEGVLSIGSEVFKECTMLTKLSLPEGLEVIGDRSFCGSNPIGGLKSLAIPSTVRSIGRGSFACNNLSEIAITGGDNAFFSAENGLLYDKVDKRVICSCMNLVTAALPDDCETIGQDAFSAGWSRVSQLTTVKWPAKLKKIEQGAFHMCTKLKSGDFSNTELAAIGEDVFVMCTSLATVKFPSTLCTLTGHDFSCCSSLREVFYFGNPPEVQLKTSHNKNMLDCIYVTTPNLAVNYSDSKQYSYSYLPNVTSYVQPGQGWDDIVATGTWQGCPIKMKTNIESEYGPFVPGEKVSVTVEELIGYTAKGLPTGLKFDSKTGTISGTPTKPTGDAGVTVTFTKKGEETLTATFIVGPLPKLSIETDGTGTVKGAGSYAANAKVSLKAASGKGQVFAGWYLSDGGQGLTALPGGVDYRTASYSYIMPAEDVTLCAKFVSSSEDTELAMENLEAEYEINSVVEMQFSVRSHSLPTVKATGLPTGLKFDAKTLVLSGTPTKPGKYTVTFTLSNLSVKNVAQPTVITVPNIESDKIGGIESDENYYNYMQGVSIGDGIEPEVEEGYTLSVSGLPKGLSCDKKTGKITGVPTAAPGAYTVVFTAKKKGAATETATITINVEAAPISAGTVFNGFVGRDEESSFANLGTFKLTFSASGALTAVIETANGKSTLTANGWSDVSGDIFKADLSDKSGNKAAIEIDIAKSFDAWQLTGSFCEKKSGTTYSVTAQMNVFGQSWYFKATKVDGENNAWTLAYAESASSADLTVTTKADGTATAKGKLGSFTVNVTSFLATDGLKDGAFMADFVQFVTVSGKKYPLSIRANLWLDGSDIHEDGAGSAKIEE